MAKKKVPSTEKESNMSESSAATENISQYWKNYFTKHPELLPLRNNDAAVQQWKEDHGGMDIPKNAMNGLTNVKSQLRKDSGVKIKKKRGRPRKPPVAAAPAVVTPAARVVKAPMKLLEPLEDQIDKCLGLINSHTELGKIVLVLKQARRLTIHEMSRVMPSGRTGFNCI